MGGDMGSRVGSSGARWVLPRAILGQLRLVAGWLLLGIGFAWIVEFSYVDRADRLRLVDQTVGCRVGFSDPVTADEVNRFVRDYTDAWAKLLYDRIDERKICVYPAVLMLAGAVLVAGYGLRRAEGGGQS